MTLFRRWATPTRETAAVLLALLAAVFVTLSVVQSWVAHAVFDDDRFAGTAVRVFERKDVQDEITRVIVDQAIQQQPDLVGGRPLIETAVRAVLSSSAVRPIVADGARELHGILFESDRRSIVLALPDVMTLVIAAIRAYDPDLATRIPGGPSIGTITLSDRNAATSILEVDRRLEALRWGFVLGAVAALGGAFFIARARRRVFATFGLGLVLAALACWFAIGLVASVVRDSVPGNAVAGNAAAAAWNMYADGLTWWLWVQALAGIVIATVATSTRVGVPARRRLQQATALVEAGWENRAGRVLMAGGCATLGAFLVIAPEVTVRIAAQAVGLGLLYLGATEVARSLGLARIPVPGQRRRAPAPPSHQPLPQLLAGAGLAASMVVVGLVFWSNRDSLQAPSAAARAPIERCNGAAELCDRRLNEVAYVATHNSMSAAEERGWYFASHERNIAEQLDDGVRVLLIDLYYGYATNAGVRTDPDVLGIPDRIEAGLGVEAGLAAQNLINTIGPIPPGAEPALYLCHAFCELGATPFDSVMHSLAAFLDANPDEVVFLFLQDYVEPTDVEASLIRTGVMEYVHTLPPGEPMPTLRDLIEADERVIVLSENRGGGDAPPWYHDGFALTQETPYAFRTAGELSCAPNRGSANSPFFLLNHWITKLSPSPADADLLNARDFLLARARQCEDERGAFPNFIAVNFYERGDVFAVVDTLNGIGD